VKRINLWEQPEKENCCYLTLFAASVLPAPDSPLNITLFEKILELKDYTNTPDDDTLVLFILL
jgi:hypothetical protein